MSKMLTFGIASLGKNIPSLERLLRSLAAQTCKDFEVLLSVQSKNEGIRKKIHTLVDSFSEQLCVRAHFSESIGLSKNRNIIFSEAKGKYTVLCDDDCQYPVDAAEKIIQAVAEHDAYEVFSFAIGITSRDPIKKYTNSITEHSLRSLMKISSVELVIKNSLTRYTPLFDERFGLGTPFNTGAENIMLCDLYREGVKFIFIPEIIVIHPPISSGCNPDNIQQLVRSKGAMFRRMFGLMGIFPAIAFYARRVLPGKKLRLMPKDFLLLLKGFLAQVK